MEKQMNCACGNFAREIEKPTEWNSEENLKQGLKSSTQAKEKGRFARVTRSFMKVPFYFLFLVLSVVVILTGLEKLAKYFLGRGVLAHVYPDNFEMARKDFTRPVSHYDYDFVPGVCIEFNTLKGNRYEYTNNAGFRDPRDISLEKPEDEFRIFLMGGSTAFGLGAVGEAAPLMNYYAIPHNETIAHMMEMLLNAGITVPGKQIRVFNAAVWGYGYQHHFMRYVTKLRQYKPDLIISLDGANEIAPISKLTEDWDYFREGQFNDILREIYSYNVPGLSSYLTLWLKNNTYLMTLFWGGRDIYQDLHQGITKETKQELFRESHILDPGWQRIAARDEKTATDALAKEIERRSRLADRNVAAVVRIVENLHSALENDGVPHVLALQPWFYFSKKKRTEQEKKLATLGGARQYYGVPSEKIYKLLVDRISQSAREKGIFLVDFSEYFDDVSEWVFSDWCHLTAGANYLISKELANLVKEHLFGTLLGRGDLIDEKDSFFWDLAASSTVIYAPEAESPENGPKNILAGYPGNTLYACRIPPEGENLEVVLDMGRSYPVSRTRLVWADQASVPEKWSIQISPDAIKWYILVEAGREEIDTYSQWPGFEYYAAKPLQGRYVKYKPLSQLKVPIRLRCWNVSR
jgi:hypothetical protein